MDFILQFLGLAYFVFALWNLRLAVLLLPLFFSAYLLKFELGGIPFPLVEVFISAVFLAWVFKAVYGLLRREVSWKQLLEPYKHPLWFGVLAIVVAAVFSVFIAPQSVVMMDGNTVFYGRKVALGIIKSWIIAPVLLLALFAQVMKSAKEMRMALNAYAGSAVFLAAWGAYQVLTGQYSTPDGRASGPFNSANYLALFITPALFYAGLRLKEFFVVERVSWWKKILKAFLHRHQDQRPQFFIVLAWAGGFFLLLFALLFTKSYAAFLAFVVAWCFWFFPQVKGLKRFPWKGAGIILLILFLAGLVLVILDPAKWELFFQLTTRTSSGVRVEIYTIATRLLAEHPFEGIGLGMFPAAYQLEGPRILGHDPYEWNMLHPHNVFLAFWLNLGLLGFLGFLWIIQVCFRKAWRFLKTLPQLVPLGIEWFHAVGLLMFIIILFHGLVDTPFFKNDLALLFWLVVGVIVFPATSRDDG